VKRTDPIGGRNARSDTIMTTLNLEHIHSGAESQFTRFPSRRSVVHSTKGIIASTQPLANEAGYKILAKGGNAADAALAVAAALNVTGTNLLGKC
jgi:gamma-glutamyltranspeptidase / glutathione hydrolase